MEEFGNVTIKIEGEGFIKETMITKIKESLSLLMGERHLIVDNVEVNPYKK